MTCTGSNRCERTLQQRCERLSSNTTQIRWSSDHPNSNRLVGRFVDEDETPGAPNIGVLIKYKRLARSNRYLSDFVELKLFAKSKVRQRVDVDSALEFSHHCPRRMSAELDPQHQP